MYKVVVDAESMIEYFHYIEYLDDDDPEEAEAKITPVKDFDYMPKHYGRRHDTNVLDNYLISKSFLDVSKVKNGEYLSSAWIFISSEVLTFEFKTEEEALYFQLKYVK